MAPEKIRLLQANMAQGKMVDRYRKMQEAFLDHLDATFLRQCMLQSVGQLLRGVEQLLLIAVGLSSVLSGKITLGEYAAFRQHVSLLDQGPKALIGFYNEISVIKMQAAVYFELLYRKSRIPCSATDGSNGKELNVGKDGLVLELDDVSFTYKLNPDVKVLDGVKLRVDPGKMVALCGGSGGGKTTITKLVHRFYDPSDGSITLNGTDIRTLDAAWLRMQIRCIDQDPTLLDMTIRDNIALGLPVSEVARGKEYVNERVVEAAKWAEADDFITTKCEKGYDTPLRQVSRLSGGQRQRIAIARALISRSPILICDEVTSALDAKTERALLVTLKEAMRGKAVLVIAHRLSTIRHADEIVFLEAGRVIERGTH
jgi:ABC-type multidrug transport system fused ATPase/permease subunit